MPALVIQSRIFGEMFGSDAMRALFSDEAMVARYVEVEAALAKAEARVGVIPEEAGAVIAETADPSRIDMALLGERTEIVGVPITPLVAQMSKWAPDGHGKWVHYGATTQDIMDTADVLQIRDALNLISEDLDGVAEALVALARDHAETPMAGRTHMQHALPISFGYKAATWLAAIDRHRARLKELRPRVEVVSFAGAAGTLASLGEEGLAVQAALARELDLGVPDITWHTARDGFAETTGLLAMICGTLGKIGTDIILLMQSEIGEVLEPYLPGRGGSSTMPQKRNPLGAEIMQTSARLLREQHGAMLDAMVQDHERASGPWAIEWHTLPTAFILASGSLRASLEVLGGLEVYPDAMRRTLDGTGGLIVSEAVMMGLAPVLGRQEAHHLVADCCRAALDTGRPFLDVLCEDPTISGAMDREDLAKLVDPANYLGSAPEMVARLLEARQKEKSD